MEDGAEAMTVSTGVGQENETLAKGGTKTDDSPAKPRTILLSRQTVGNTRIPSQVDGKCVATLRVMTWNTLAQSLALDSFPRAPIASLGATSRGERLVSEMLRWEPDVLCLQEVDTSGTLSKRYFEETLGKNGYFLAIDAVKRNGNDGCCVFIRSSLHDSVGLKATRSLADSNQVAACVHLTDRNGLNVLVGTTHLKAKKGHEKLREKQSLALRDLFRTMAPKGASFILCGDFNADPSEPAVTAMKKEGWRSAYLECCTTEPYSTWKIRASGEVKRCIDYVWLHNSEEQSIWVNSCVLPPNEDAVSEERFPNWQFPSDHINLVVDLGFYTRGGTLV